MTTNEYCLLLLDKVDEAGCDPDLAYLVRSRLRRAIVALERGRREPRVEVPLDDAPPEIQARVKELNARVMSLCQPSEALDVRWKREWASVLNGVAELRRWIQAKG